MIYGRCIQPMGRRARVLALVILTGLLVTAGACTKDKPASDPRQVADRFMELYYGRMNMTEARKLSSGDAWKKIKAQMDNVKGVQPDNPAGEPKVTFEVTASDKPTSAEASYSYRVTPHTSDVSPIAVQLRLAVQKGRWKVASFSETTAAAK